MKKAYALAALAAGFWNTSALAQPLGNPEKAVPIAKAVCAPCHGATGDGLNPLYPKLAGQHAEYLTKQLKAFKKRERPAVVMNELAKMFSDEDIVNLAAYFSAQKSSAGEPKDAGLAMVGHYIFHSGNMWSGVPPCAICHGPSGEGRAGLPRIAGQHARYLERQLAAFRSKERVDAGAIMQSVAANLTELELKAVAEYLTALQQQ